MNTLITGANGQLGNELRKLHTQFPQHQFIFTDIGELDITHASDVQDFFLKNGINCCINVAAYTAVDKAETDAEMAQKINVEAVKYLAQACRQSSALFIHISTDYVFNGRNYTPYHEADAVAPTSLYGKTKAEGEQIAIQENPHTIVIRTSWLYSTFGNNFVKTMLRLAESKPELRVVADQVGTPTYAEDLANAILQIIDFLNFKKDKDIFGIYHYSNEGVASWYDFAHAIFEIRNLKIDLKPIKTVEYPTPATRPAYSILDKYKIKNTFGIAIPHWRESLKRCLNS
jgi:dTDP-4-dehydrorhamnose reductase